MIQPALLKFFNLANLNIPMPKTIEHD